MPLASLAGVLGMLVLVLGLLVVTLRWLRRLVPRASGSAGLSLEVLARMPLGPRQGIAVVRIGTRRVALSVGDGGVRPLLELDDDGPLPAVDALPETASAALVPATFGATGQFRRVLHGVLGGAAFIMVLGSAAFAQGAATPARPATNAAAKPGVAKPKAAAVARPVGRLAVARIDSAVPTLAPRIDLSVGDAAKGGLKLSGTVGVVVMMGLLSLLPMLMLMMTGFTRILIVLSFLRQAIGAQSAPPTQLVAGLALLLTGFVMTPTLTEVNKTALEPWMDGKMEQMAMLTEGAKPFRAFMLKQVREADLASFLALSRTGPVDKPEDVPLVVLTSAFVTSELRTAFQIGFALFLPFIVIDVVVASVLMSMGMMMVPPAMIALPFKLLLFVLVDGWTLVIQGLVQGFRP